MWIARTFVVGNQTVTLDHMKKTSWEPLRILVSMPLFELCSKRMPSIVWATIYRTRSGYTVGYGEQTMGEQWWLYVQRWLVYRFLPWVKSLTGTRKTFLATQPSPCHSWFDRVLRASSFIAALPWIRKHIGKDYHTLAFYPYDWSLNATTNRDLTDSAVEQSPQRYCHIF